MLKSKHYSKTVACVGAGLVFIIIAWWSSCDDMWTKWDYQALDYLYKKSINLGLGPKNSNEIVYLDITDETYDKIRGKYSERQYLSRALGFLRQLNPYAVASDIVFRPLGRLEDDLKLVESINQVDSFFFPVVLKLTKNLTSNKTLNRSIAKRLKEIPSDLIEGVGGTKKKFNELSLEECFDIMKVEANRHKIYKELDARDEQFLIFRIIHIYDELSDGQKISERLINTQKDVERQLYRIYRLRNKLAHRAFHNNVPPQFIDNLITYLLSSYSILISFSTYDKIQDFESQDIFNVFEASHEKMISKLKGETSLEELELSTVLIDSQY